MNNELLPEPLAAKSEAQSVDANAALAKVKNKKAAVKKTARKKSVKKKSAREIDDKRNRLRKKLLAKSLRTSPVTCNGV